MCHNCLDRHIMDGYGKQPAIIYSSPVTETVEVYSFDMLYEKVIQFSFVLKNLGVQSGDRVLINMPNSPRAAIAMLACARIGAVHCVVFGGFAAHEVAVRIRDSKPRVIVSSSCGIEGNKIIDYKTILDHALEETEKDHQVSHCIVYQRAQHRAQHMRTGRDVDWQVVMDKVPREVNVPCEAVLSTHPLYILYTSGTTGQPKGVVRDTGGYAVALHWSMYNIYGMNPGEVWWAASDVGWVVGHSYSLYGPLLNRNTTILYEGKPIGTPDAGAFWRHIAQYNVAGMFTAPTAIRAIKLKDPEGALARDHPMPSLRTLFLAGERADPATIRWAESILHVPVRDHWWQTESGWPICGNMVGAEGYLPIKYGSSFRTVPAYDLRVFDELEPIEVTESSSTNRMGRLAIKLPLPPGFMSTLYNNEKRFVDSYMAAIPGYYDTGDAGVIDHDGYVHILTRTDDVINVAGHRLSTGAMEEVRSFLSLHNYKLYNKVDCRSLRTTLILQKSPWLE